MGGAAGGVKPMTGDADLLMRRKNESRYDAVFSFDATNSCCGLQKHYETKQ